MVVMTMPFHIQYLIENWDTRLIIDIKEQVVTIEEKNYSYTCKFEDLRTERYLGGHHKPGRIKSFEPIPFDYYGYVKIRTKDERFFYITSLMTDPFDFPLPISHTKYGFPIINKRERTMAEKRRHITFTKRQKTEEYIERFSMLPQDILLEKVNNAKRYEIEAVKAAEFVLDQRKKITPGDL